MDRAVLCHMFGELRTCLNMADACATLAEMLARTGGAAACTVFLLDCTGTKLLPQSCWSSGADVQQKVSTVEALSPTKAPHGRYLEYLSFDVEDPLCFAMQSGKPYCVATLSGSVSSFACLDFLPPFARSGGLLALPLIALKDTCIGAVLLGGISSSGPKETDVALVCDLGALVLDMHLQLGKEQEKLRSMHADITRLANTTGINKGAVANIFIGAGVTAQRIRESITRAAEGDFPVLITGETGTGKELAAQALHAASSRREAPFVRINCGALPPQLMESELFGHCKGAFSGAHTEHIGLLRSAHGGTVLLDEVGEMPVALQVKLLRVLQDHEVRPVGGMHSFPVDLRVIAATNRDMREAITSGNFRQDLYYRLAALHIHLPPLRERREDIPVLAEYFLEQIAIETQRTNLRLAFESSRMLYTHDFPGNTRQLRDMIRCAVFMSDVGVTCLTPELLQWRKEDSLSDAMDGGLAAAVRQFERRLIEVTLARCDGNVTEAAKELALPRSTLVSKIRKSANVLSVL